MPKYQDTTTNSITITICIDNQLARKVLHINVESKEKL